MNARSQLTPGGFLVLLGIVVVTALLGWGTLVYAIAKGVCG